MTDEDLGQQTTASITREQAKQRVRESFKTANREEQAISQEELLVGSESVIEPTLSIILPTLNEERGISICLEWIKTVVAELQVATEIIVSDSSTDQTPEIAREKGAIVVRPDQIGYGYAYRYAFNYARGQYIVIGDADTTYDFRELPRLLDKMMKTGADMVLGSRLNGEIEPGAMPWLHQHIGNPLLTQILNIFYSVDISDAHSGFRVIRREALETLDLETGGMEFASEMIIEAAAKGLHIEETPITYHKREGEATLQSFPDGWRHVRFMLQKAPEFQLTNKLKRL